MYRVMIDVGCVSYVSDEFRLDGMKRVSGVKDYVTLVN